MKILIQILLYTYISIYDSCIFLHLTREKYKNFILLITFGFYVILDIGT